MSQQPEKEKVSISHYAPDITLTAIGYIVPGIYEHEQRMQQAERRIKDFLASTNPDSLCDGFYDRFAEEEEALIIAILREQTPNHNDANASIALKHSAELKRLDLAIRQAESTVEAFDKEIGQLQQLYDQYN